MRSTNDYAGIFWVFIIITGEVIVMKLFLALFINNYLEILSTLSTELLEENETEKDDIDIDSIISSDDDLKSHSELIYKTSYAPGSDGNLTYQEGNENIIV